MIGREVHQGFSQLQHSLGIYQVLDGRLRSLRINAMNQQNAIVTSFIWKHQHQRVVAPELVRDRIEFRLVNRLLALLGGRFRITPL